MTTTTASTGIVNSLTTGRLPKWAPWALFSLALVPPLARPLTHGLARLGDAIALHPRIAQLLQQSMTQCCTLPEALQSLELLLAPTGER